MRVAEEIIIFLLHLKLELKGYNWMPEIILLEKILSELQQISKQIIELNNRVNSIDDNVEKILKK